MVNIFAVAFNFCQITLCVTSIVLLLNKVFGYDYRVRKIPTAVVSVLLFALNIVASLKIANPDDVDLYTELMGFGFGIIYPYLLFKPEKKTVFLKFALAVCATYDFVVLSLCSVFNVQSLMINRIAYCAVYAIVMLFGVVLGRKVRGRIPEDFLSRIPTMIYIVIFFASLSAFYDITSLIDSDYSAGIATGIRLFLSLLVVWCIVTVALRYSNLISRQREAELQLEMELKHYEEMTQKNREIRSFRHDYQNNLSSLRVMVAEDRREDALNYIDNLNIPLKKTQNKYATGNYLADAILSGKSAQAENQGAIICFKGNVPQHGISNNDLCTILANGLDNAIRGCNDCIPCTVSVEAKQQANWFTVVIKNPVKDKVQIKNNTVKTSKADKENHGFGLENIKRVAKKYNGRVELACDENEFTLKVFMMLEGV